MRKNKEKIIENLEQELKEKNNKEKINNDINYEGQHDYESFRKKKAFKDSFFELDE